MIGLHPVELIAKILPDGCPLNFERQAGRIGEVYQTWCDNSKSIKMLGNYINTTLETGLRRTVDWYGKHYQSGTSE